MVKPRHGFPQLGWQIREKRTSAFTLIELLIVIAIILIVIAIAMPNFLEAQVRAQVIRVKGDLHGLSTAMEQYYQDFKVYPAMHDNSDRVTYYPNQVLFV